ncbi:MAG: hypothetical protein HRT88_18915, partial [Lentisphaeraceae bacterium]|nr:hypothetical protein [Lentisphaeraceae bacterium]
GHQANFKRWGATIKAAEAATQAGKDPAKALLKVTTKSAKTLTAMIPQSATDKRAYAAVAAWLKKNKLTSQQAFENKKLLAQTGALLKKNASEIKPNICLKGLLIIKGQRPSKRTLAPKVSTFLKFLVKIHQIPARKLNLEKGQRWPLFPTTTTAPWPILMPLACTMPLDEAQYIWEKFQGKHGRQRLHTYGPYNVGEKKSILTLEESKWHWASWPSLIKVGGRCGTMSTVAMGCLTALGRPTLKAFQPGHSCLVTYNVTSNGKFTSSVSQGVTAGPDGTGAPWLFRDGSTWDCNNAGAKAVHHFGLALAMNSGLDSYMDSRIALHIYKTLPAELKTSHGIPLLISCLAKNLYNTELWYTLARDTRSFKLLIKLLTYIDRKLPKHAGAEVVKARGDASAAISGAQEQTNRVTVSAANNIAAYRQLIERSILKNAFAEPTNFSVKDQQLALSFLKQYKDNSTDMQLAYDRFQTALTGPAVIQKQVLQQLQYLITNTAKGKHERRAMKSAERTFTFRLAQTALLIKDNKEVGQWLRSLMKSVPLSKAVLSNNKGEKRFSKLYEQILGSLRTSYLVKPRNKQGLTGIKELRTKMLK